MRGVRSGEGYADPRGHSRGAAGGEYIDAHRRTERKVHGEVGAQGEGDSAQIGEGNRAAGEVGQREGGDGKAGERSGEPCG